jgi:hypothetical protein
MVDKIRVTIPAPSAQGALNAVDYKKILKGAGLAFGAAALYSIAAWLSAGQVEWNVFLTVCIPAAISTGINAALKWWAGQPQ